MPGFPPRHSFPTRRSSDLSMNVFENIRLGITNEAQYRDTEYCEGRVKECLRLVNLAQEVAQKMPSELSGGMRKRVGIDRKSTRLNSSHLVISYAVFCLKQK